MKPTNPFLLRAGLFSMLLTLTLCIGLVDSAWAAERSFNRYVRFQAGDKVTYGVVEGPTVHEISAKPYEDWKKTGESYPLSGIKPLVPTEPTKVLSVALNYKSHVDQRSGQQLPEIPQIFYKTPSCLIAQGEQIVLPKGSTNVHYEAEMVIVMGKRARDVSKEQALDYVLGVTCGNDVSARDWQDSDIQWWRAKGADTFGPCGPYVVSGMNYDKLRLQMRKNGEVKLTTQTSEMVHSVADLVSFISRYVTLEPGDLIFTGTAGITEAIKPGDVVQVEIQGVGTLTNPVVAEQ